jgi:UDP-glucose 6-dehydrogenase
MVSLDRRIGTYGTKLGNLFGSTCLPTHSEALATLAEEIGITPDVPTVILDMIRRYKIFVQ